MSTIQIKRGLQENVNGLSLAEGEFAVALDTGNVYIGTSSGVTHVNPKGGTADTAVKLATARAFSISGDGTAAAVNFDGTAAVNLVLALAKQSGLTAGTYSKVTVNAKGLVTAGAALAASDLPTIPTSKISGLGSAASKTAGTASGNVPVLDSSGKLPTGVIPSLAIMDVYEAKDEAAMLALSCQKGDICIRTDEAKTYILAADGAATLANWKWLQTPDCKVQSVNGQTGAVTIGAATTSAAGLMSATDKSKLEGIASGANKYTHPSYTAKSSGLYKVTVDGTGHVSAAAAVAKGDITALGIPAQDTTYSAMTAATADAAGKSGLVPAPAAGNQSKFLRGDGSWQTPANTDTKVNVTLGTTTKAYLLGTSTTPASTAAATAAIADTGVYLDTTAGKLTAGSFAGSGASLTGLNASNLSSGTVPAARIPAATTSALGGVKVGTGLAIASGVLSVGDIDGGTF